MKTKVPNCMQQTSAPVINSPPLTHLLVTTLQPAPITSNLHMPSPYGTEQPMFRLSSTLSLQSRVATRKLPARRAHGPCQFLGCAYKSLQEVPATPGQTAPGTTLTV